MRRNIILPDYDIPLYIPPVLLGPPAFLVLLVSSLPVEHADVAVNICLALVTLGILGRT